MDQGSKKWKIVNDPVYGFIKIPPGLIYELVEHPLVQRLRRIRQLGLTNFVYPGATHTRFQHALGALHLMLLALEGIKTKRNIIDPLEEEGVSAAILLHDIGHGPFSHALEYSLIEGINHEDLTLFLMEHLNPAFDDRLIMALKIFRNAYPKSFLCQLVSGQLDMDRMDYLKRDSFFTGVIEGTIGSDRIIKMLDVINDQLVVEIKGIYSIEKFLIARRLMYWQVYYHKTVIAAEQMLVKLLQRARELSESGIRLFATPALEFFLKERVSREEIMPYTGSERQLNIVRNFTQLDDNDIMTAAKVWQDHEDKVLKELSRRMIHRKLPAIEMQRSPFEQTRIIKIRRMAEKEFSLSEAESNYFVFTGEISNYAYSRNDEHIKILLKDASVVDVTEASEMLHPDVLSKTVSKHYLCFPKEYRKTI